MPTGLSSTSAPPRSSRGPPREITSSSVGDSPLRCPGKGCSVAVVLLSRHRSPRLGTAILTPPPRPPVLRRPSSPRAATRTAHPPSGAIGAFGPVRSLSGGFGRCPFGRLRSGRRAELGRDRRGLGTHRRSSLPPSAEIGHCSSALGTLRLAGPHHSGTRPRSGGLGSHPIRQVPLRAAPRGLGRAPLASQQGARAPAAFARGPSGSGRFGPHRNSVERPRTRSSAVGQARLRSARRSPLPAGPPSGAPGGGGGAGSATPGPAHGAARRQLGRRTARFARGTGAAAGAAAGSGGGGGAGGGGNGDGGRRRAHPDGSTANAKRRRGRRRRCLRRSGRAALPQPAWGSRNPGSGPHTAPGARAGTASSLRERSHPLAESHTPPLHTQ